jgi:hypothetical protein
MEAAMTEPALVKPARIKDHLGQEGVSTNTSGEQFADAL